MPSARAGVGCSYKGDPAGEGTAQSRSADPMNSFLQWLTQLIEDGSRKFSEFIQKQHASMGQAQFTGTRIDSAAKKSRCRGAVMRCTERTLPNQACHVAEGASNGLEASDLKSLRVAQRRKNLGKLARQHRFATARRPHHQEVVSTGGGNGQCLSGDMLDCEGCCGGRG